VLYGYYSPETTLRLSALQTESNRLWSGNVRSEEYSLHRKTGGA
jgi:hypothetical protein